MTFGITLGEHLMMAPSASMFYIAIFHKDKTNMEVAASNIDISIIDDPMNIALRKISEDLTRTC